MENKIKDYIDERIVAIDEMVRKIVLEMLEDKKAVDEKLKYGLRNLQEAVTEKTHGNDMNDSIVKDLSSLAMRIIEVENKIGLLSFKGEDSSRHLDINRTLVDSVVKDHSTLAVRISECERRLSCIDSGKNFSPNSAEIQQAMDAWKAFL